jgi:hypothetical protein
VGWVVLSLREQGAGLAIILLYSPFTQTCRGCNVALLLCCSKIAEAEAAVSVNEKKWFNQWFTKLVMHMHVQLKLDELRGPPLLLCADAHGLAEVVLLTDGCGLHGVVLPVAVAAAHTS